MQMRARIQKKYKNNKIQTSISITPTNKNSHPTTITLPAPSFLVFVGGNR
jgi:hypothetical protein